MTLRILICLLSLILCHQWIAAAHHDGANENCVEALLSPYFATQEALAGDNLKSAQAAAQDLQAAHKAHPCSEAIRTANAQLIEAQSIKTARKAFKSLSEAFIPLVKASELQSGEAHLVYCPMAFEFTGASWLQKNKSVANPYFGAEMFACGAFKESFGSDQ